MAIWLWVKTNGIPFWGFGAPPILEPILVVGLNRMFTGGTIWILTHGHIVLRSQELLPWKGTATVLTVNRGLQNRARQGCWRGRIHHWPLLFRSWTFLGGVGVVLGPLWGRGPRFMPVDQLCHCMLRFATCVGSKHATYGSVAWRKLDESPLWEFR